MKRILMISYHTCPLAFEEGKETGGMNIYVYELSQTLARMGYSIDVITRCQDDKNPKIVQVEKNFRVIHLVAGPSKPVNKKILPEFIPEFVKSFQKFVKEEKLTYDVMHAHYYQSGIIALEIKKTVPTLPFVMTFHTLALMKNLVARTSAELEGETRIQAEFLLMKKANAIIAPSLSDKMYLEYLYSASKDKVFEVPPGVNTTIFKPMNKEEAKDLLGLSKKEKIILFVGRVEPLKGIDLLLYSVKILLSQVPSCALQLLIVGGDVSQHIMSWSPQLKHLEELRRILDITQHVTFVGQKAQHKLAYYYNAAEVVVMPSHYESFGMAAAEAMASGTPVITTNVTGISSLIDEERPTLITTVNNPLLLASQLRRLLTNETLYKQIQENNLENVKTLSWDAVVKQIEAVYKAIL